MIKSAVTHVDVKDNIVLITADGISGEASTVSRIFSAIAGQGIDVDMITLSPRHKHGMDLSFTVSGDDLGAAVTAMGGLKSDIPRFMCHISGNNAKITLSGTAVFEHAGIVAEVLSVPAKTDTPVKLISASVNEIALLIDEGKADAVVAEFKKRYMIK